MVEFKLNDSDDIVVVNGVIMSMLDVAQGNMKTDASPIISYHTLVMTPGAAGSFTLEQTHRVVYPKNEGTGDNVGTDLQSTIGAKLGLSYWSSPVSVILWAARWTAKGVMPVKPVVYLSGSPVLASGRSLSFDAS